MQFKITQQQRKARGIYRIINEATQGFYIGSAEQLVTRWNRHARELRQDKHSNPHLQAAFRKYGEEAFVFEVATEVGTGEDLLRLEQGYLDAYFGPGCYNLCAIAGAPGSRLVTDETRAKLSASNKGKKRTPEQRARMSEALMGRILSPASRERMSLAAQKRVFSPELRARMADGRRAAHARRAAQKALSQ